MEEQSRAVTSRRGKKAWMRHAHLLHELCCHSLLIIDLRFLSSGCSRCFFLLLGFLLLWRRRLRWHSRKRSGEALRFQGRRLLFGRSVGRQKWRRRQRGGTRRGRGGGRPAPTPLPSRTISNRSAQCSAQGTRHAPCGRTDHPTIRVAVPTGQRLRIDVTLKHPPPRTYVRTVIVGLRENRDLEGTHRFCHFLLSKLMCNGHLLNVSIPISGKSHAPFL